MIQPTTGPLYQPPEGRAIPGPPWGGQPAWEPATPGRVAVWCALALVAVRFSFVNDLITVLLGVNLRLLYIVTVPALVGFFFSGGLRRVFQSRAAICWIAFSLWAVLATPFSWWRGGSVDLLWQYFRTNFPMLLVIAGIVVTWKDCKRLMTVLALSGATTLIYTRVFAHDFGGGRLGLEFGAMAGPHDMAAHILLLLPFLLWIVLTPKRFFLWRMAATGAILLGLHVVVEYGVAFRRYRVGCRPGCAAPAGYSAPAAGHAGFGATSYRRSAGIRAGVRPPPHGVVLRPGSHGRAGGGAILGVAQSVIA